MNHTDAKGPVERLKDTTRELEETNRQLCEQIVVNMALRKANLSLEREKSRLQDEITRLRGMFQ